MAHQSNGPRRNYAKSPEILQGVPLPPKPGNEGADLKNGEINIVTPPKLGSKMAFKIGRNPKQRGMTLCEETLYTKPLFDYSSSSSADC